VYACVFEQCGMSVEEMRRLKGELDALRDRLLSA